MGDNDAPTNKITSLIETYGFYFFILLLIVITFFSIPKKMEQGFLVLGLLGENKTISNYFDNDNSVDNESNIYWHLFLNNRMKTKKDVEIRVKMMNSSILFPNSKDCIPSSIESFYNIDVSLNVNEERYTLFHWGILAFNVSDENIIINKMIINNDIIDVEINALDGTNMYMVFELWVFNEELGIYEFSWESRNERYCVWNEIWFTVDAY